MKVKRQTNNKTLITISRNKLFYGFISDIYVIKSKGKGKGEGESKSKSKSKIKSKSKSKKTLFKVGQCKQKNVSSHLKWVLVADKNMHNDQIQ